MTTLARRLDPCVVWFKTLDKTRGRILWLFPVGLLAAYLGTVFAQSPDFTRLTSNPNAALLSEARRLALTYDRVDASSVGKPVVWCVSTPGADSYVSFRPAWSVGWTNRARGDQTSSGTGSYCINTLAVIEGIENGVVKLRFVERL